MFDVTYYLSYLIYLFVFVNLKPLRHKEAVDFYLCISKLKCNTGYNLYVWNTQKGHKI